MYSVADKKKVRKKERKKEKLMKSRMKDAEKRGSKEFLLGTKIGIKGQVGHRYVHMCGTKAFTIVLFYNFNMIHEL